MRVAWLLVALSACGRVGFESDVAGDGAAGPPDGARFDGAVHDGGSTGADAATPDGSAADGSPVDTTELRDAGGVDRPNRAFVTSTTYTGDFGGAAVADAACQAHAETAGLEGTFVALLETSTQEPLDRLLATGSRGWVDLFEAPIADDPTDWLEGRMLYPLRRDETGALVGYQTLWIGGSETCQDWTTAAVGERGMVANTTRLFTQFTYTGCQESGALICVELGHSAPVMGTPQPGRLAFLSTSPFVSGGGLAAADAQCAEDAAAAGLSGSFLALLSTSTMDAFARFALDGPTWTRVDGLAIAPTAADVAGPLPEYLDTFTAMRPDGSPVLNALVWTGTATYNCNDWTSASASVLGASGNANTVYRDQWRPDRGFDCAATVRRVLCFQE